ncbi:hypothetical protein [Streptomyces thermovulgaris]|uniref:hypothetical protein n=1 Tax=Streptomyces thermovulgaris TaxID=1934 RepID=UPI001180F342|nr:hypothetical protein [Streptomyces thermovulgaris]
MEKVQKDRKVFDVRRDVKVLLLFLAALGIFCGAGWIFLVKGIYLLPEKMCEGTLERDMVKRVLPQARSANSGFSTRGAGHNLTFSCYATTSNDSSLSGEARAQPTSRDKWLKYYRGAGSQRKIIRVSVGDVEALALTGSSATSSVYIPCAPPAVPSHNASQPYAVIGEARVYGQAKASGVSLRQDLTDFAYQLAEHAYKLAKCKPSRDFPEELPRYEDD